MGFPLLEGSESTQKAGAGLGSVKRLTLKLEKCIRLTSVIQFSCTACRFLQLGMRETQLICFFTDLVGVFFFPTHSGKKIFAGGGAGVQWMLREIAHQGLVCFVTVLIQSQVACKKEQGWSISPVTEFKWREAASWVPVCSLI